MPAPKAVAGGVYDPVNTVNCLPHIGPAHPHTLYKLLANLFCQTDANAAFTLHVDVQSNIIILMKFDARQRAFSLVELSIVLVILGLLVGGVLAGQSLIRAAELRSISTEYARYATAAQTFRDKYFAVPGDMTNGTAFWGRRAATGACVTNSGAALNTTTGVCDGDGDGRLTETGAGFYPDERFVFWRALANAGLIEGTYTGTTVAGGSFHSQGGVNVPRARMNNALWYTNSRAASSGSTVEFVMEYGNFLQIGAYQANLSPNSSIMYPEEAWNIDTKMDDGMPGRGTVIAADRSMCANATSDVDYAATYLLDFKDTLRCRLMFRNAF